MNTLTCHNQCPFILLSLFNYGTCTACLYACFCRKYLYVKKGILLYWHVPWAEATLKIPFVNLPLSYYIFKHHSKLYPNYNLTKPIREA